MLIRKLWTGTMTVVAVVAFASWASVAQAALPEDVAAALSADKTPAQQAAAIQAIATANPGDPNFTQLVQLMAAGISQQQAAAFAGALAAATGVSGNNAQTTQTIVSVMVGAFPEAGGAIVGAVIAAGGSAEVAARTLQLAILAASGQFLALREVLRDPNPGPGVNPNQEAFVKSRNTTRLGNRNGVVFQPLQEGAMSPTKGKDKGPELPEIVPPPQQEE